MAEYLGNEAVANIISAGGIESCGPQAGPVIATSMNNLCQQLNLNMEDLAISPNQPSYNQELNNDQLSPAMLQPSNTIG